MSRETLPPGELWRRIAGIADPGATSFEGVVQAADDLRHGLERDFTGDGHGVVLHAACGQTRTEVVVVAVAPVGTESGRTMVDLWADDVARVEGAAELLNAPQWLHPARPGWKRLAVLMRTPRIARLRKAVQPWEL